MYTALQNPTGPLETHGKDLVSIRGNNYGNVKSGGTLDPFHGEASVATDGTLSLPERRENPQHNKNFFYKVSEKKNEAQRLNNEKLSNNKQALPTVESVKKTTAFENKKLSQSYVVYH